MKAAVLALVLTGCSSCSGGTLSPAVVQGINLGVCVLEQYASDASCRTSATWVQCTGDIAKACGSDVASVVNLLAAHKKAMIADGVVLPPDGGR